MPDLVDAAVIFGTGFAPFRGGPLAYARSRGVAAVVARLDGARSALRRAFSAGRGLAAASSAQAGTSVNGVPARPKVLCYHRMRLQRTTT